MNRNTLILLVLRILCLVAAILAIADTALPLPARGRSVALVMDLSDSVLEYSHHAWKEAALRLLGGLDRRDRVSLFVFAGSPSLILKDQSPAEAARLLATASPAATDSGNTDIAGAISFAKANLPGNSSRKLIFLLSDGQANKGVALDRLSLGSDGIRIYPIPLGHEPQLRYSGELNVPVIAREDEGLEGEFIFTLEEAGSYLVEAEYDDEKLFSREFMADGKTLRDSFTFRSGEAGQKKLELILYSSGMEELGRVSSIIHTGSPDRVIVARGREGDGEGIAAALNAQGIPAIAIDAGELPEDESLYAGVRALVLDNVSARDVPARKLAVLADYVAGGGGLLVVGGPDSLGRGAYYDSPLDPVLPVDTDLRKRLLFTRSRLLFIVDSSGSMGDLLGESAKQMVAMQAVAAAIKELEPLDEVGIISFDTAPHWVHPFDRVNDGSAALSSLSYMYEGGGTDIEAAVLEALRAFAGPGPSKRHAILISDGQSGSFNAAEMAGRLREAGISLTAIAIGGSVKEDDMRTLAIESGGSYYRAELDALPLLVAQDAASLSQDIMVEERASVEGEFADCAFPDIGGYVLVRARPGAVTHLYAKRDEHEDPLLAEWRYGAGRVMVFSPDSGARWLASWAGRPAYNCLWAGIIRRIERAPSLAVLDAKAFSDGGKVKITVEARDRDGWLESGLNLAGKSGETVFGLRESTPGFYEAELEAREGLNHYSIFDRSSTASYTDAWAWVAGDRESAERGRDDAYLARIARESGGELLIADAIRLPSSGATFHKIASRLFFGILAILLLIAELATRSIQRDRM